MVSKVQGKIGADGCCCCFMLQAVWIENKNTAELIQAVRAGELDEVT